MSEVRPQDEDWIPEDDMDFEDEISEAELNYFEDEDKYLREREEKYWDQFEECDPAPEYDPFDPYDIEYDR